MKKAIGIIGDFIKKETVLSAAVVLALISVFFVRPDREYAGYVDFRTLSILFCLMAVMAGLREIGIFDMLAQKLLNRVEGVTSTVFVLWTLCFFFSMLITNDVALITFVPFTITVLDMLGGEYKKRLMIPVVVMQTVAANLGSMLTPIGNPQNLYLYGKADMGFGSFIMLMLPYTVLALVLLIVWNFVFCRKISQAVSADFSEKKQIGSIRRFVGFLVLFVLCLLTVAHMIEYYYILAATVLYLIIFERGIFRKVDYALLLTFTGFFVFIGNMGRIDGFRSFLESIISRSEILTAVVSSQAISNVPAALLLSGFTDNYRALIIGTNIGGLGTLIASMASLISFKYIGREDKSARGKYLAYFTVANVIFMVFMLVLVYIVN